jgi:hypothetical protein
MIHILVQLKLIPVECSIKSKRRNKINDFREIVHKKSGLPFVYLIDIQILEDYLVSMVEIENNWKYLLSIHEYLSKLFPKIEIQI